MKETGIYTLKDTLDIIKQWEWGDPWERQSAEKSARRGLEGAQMLGHVGLVLTLTVTTTERVN